MNPDSPPVAEPVETTERENIIRDALLSNNFKGRGNILLFPTGSKRLTILGSFSGLSKIEQIAKNLTRNDMEINTLSPLDCMMYAGKTSKVETISDAKMKEMFLVLHNPNGIKDFKEEIAYACLCAASYCGSLVKVLQLPGIVLNTKDIKVGYKFYGQIMAYIWLYLYETIRSSGSEVLDAMETARQLLIVGLGAGEEIGFALLAAHITKIINSTPINIVEKIKLLPSHVCNTLLAIDANAFGSINNSVRFSLTWWLKAQHTEAQRSVLHQLYTFGVIGENLGGGTGVYSNLNPCVSCQTLNIEALPFAPFKYLKRDRETHNNSKDGTWTIWSSAN